MDKSEFQHATKSRVRFYIFRNILVEKCFINLFFSALCGNSFRTLRKNFSAGLSKLYSTCLEEHFEFQKLVNKFIPN